MPPKRNTPDVRLVGVYRKPTRLDSEPAKLYKAGISVGMVKIVSSVESSQGQLSSPAVPRYLNPAESLRASRGVGSCQSTQKNSPACGIGLRRPGGSALDGQPGAAPSPLVKCAYGHQPNIKTSMKVYDFGVEVAPEVRLRGGHGKGGRRGKIKTFSAQSSSRLNRFLITQTVPQALPYSFVLTCRPRANLSEWKRLLKCLRKALLDKGLAAVHRPELHRSGWPHLNLIVWVPPALENEIVPWLRQRWQLILAEWDTATSRRCCRGKPAKDVAQFLYAALHGSKHKRDQLGYQGKQWGVINRQKFVARRFAEFQVSEKQRAQIQRALRRVCKHRKAKLGKRFPQLGAYRRITTGETVLRLLRFYGACELSPGNGRPSASV